MSDEADRSDAKIAATISDAIAAASRFRPAEATGGCLFCATPLPLHLRFCDADCRDDYDREQRIKAIGGV